MNMKVLLLCTSHNDLGLIRGLKKLGCYIVATGNRPNSPGEIWVDKWIQADYSDKELILKIAQDEAVDAICPCCNDFGVYTASYVAEKLNLPGHDSYDTTLTLHNKGRFKEFAAKNNIFTPAAKSFSDIDSAVKFISAMDFPIIIKPTDCSAGNGVSKVQKFEDAPLAVEKAFKKSRVGKIVVEPFIEGTQHGFCTYLVNQKVVAFCSNNEYSIHNPYRVEIDTFPADNWEKCYKFLIEQIEKTAAILKLKDGIFHLQYIYSNGKPHIIEVMRRVLGNMYSVPANPLNGIDWDYWEARARCGFDCKDFPQPIFQEGFFAYKEIMSERNGRIAKINIPENYRHYVFDKFMLLKEGDFVKDHMNQPVGFLFLMFENAAEMHRVLIDEYRCDLVEIDWGETDE